LVQIDHSLWREEIDLRQQQAMSRWRIKLVVVLDQKPEESHASNQGYAPTPLRS
jgi:hypothetical protein